MNIGGLGENKVLDSLREIIKRYENSSVKFFFFYKFFRFRVGMGYDLIGIIWDEMYFINI